MADTDSADDPALATGEFEDELAVVLGLRLEDGEGGTREGTCPVCEPGGERRGGGDGDGSEGIAEGIEGERADGRGGGHERGGRWRAMPACIREAL